MNKLLIIFLLIPLLFINIPPYIELNNLAIIEEIGIKQNKENYTLYLKEIIPIKEELGIPVKLVGVGEKIDDLQPFIPQDYVEALFE